MAYYDKRISIYCWGEHKLYIFQKLRMCDKQINNFYWKDRELMCSKNDVFMTNKLKFSAGMSLNCMCLQNNL